MKVYAFDRVPDGFDVLATNLFTNPSFEIDALIPVGAVRSTDWSAHGSYSLYVPLTSGYGHGSYGHGAYGAGPALGE